MYRNSFKSWPSNSIGESSILIHQVCGFGLWSHHIEESTNECFHKWNKSMSLPLSKISKWKKYLFTFKERKGGRKKGRETSVCERYINWLPLTHPQLRTWPTTQACALTGNWTSNPSDCTLVLNPLSHTSQGIASILVTMSDPGWDQKKSCPAEPNPNC